MYGYLSRSAVCRLEQTLNSESLLQARGRDAHAIELELEALLRGTQRAAGAGAAAEAVD